MLQESEWLEWQNYPQTKEFLRYLRLLKLDGMQRWANKEFSPFQGLEVSGLNNAHALGAIDQLKALEALVADGKLLAQWVEQLETEVVNG